MIPVSAKPLFLTDHNAIREWLDTYCVIEGDVILSDSGSVSVMGDVRFIAFQKKHLTHFAVKFDTVSGSFSCASSHRLRSLEGAPTTVGYTFNCSDCSALTTLQGAPETVGCNFECSYCTALQNLVGSPQWVGGDYWVGSRRLRTIDGVSAIGGMLRFTEEMQFTADMVRSLLQHRVKVGYANCRIVYTYHETGDLIAAIAAFEAHFGVPFHDPIQPILTNSELPTL